MRNLLMVLVAVLGASAMVHAFPAKGKQTAPVKEVTATKQPKNKADKKTKAVKTEASKEEKAKVKK
ncbi:hypothetical protein [Flavobacterium sp. KACC 22761]|uniref:hypothetical protein n=1 Tax=Flavobacterium sp. KACC 22761 TaxID=3092665 RepID=UPI002A75D020|nr:hypothetical protein [Flavobacterium sp. KACC 22761]WPO80693.1 hypothetical protein SCB73_09935 [Flavobacterium sp. KACC 22761]